MPLFCCNSVYQYGGRLVTAMTLAPVQFGVIPAHHWYQPEWIDESLAERTRKTMASEGVIYGGTPCFEYFKCLH